MISEVVDGYLADIEADTRRVADGEWGITVPDVGGWPLHVGMRVVGRREPLLRAQAEVVGPGQVDEHEVLFRNRSLAIVRYAHTGEGAVLAMGELPEPAIVPRELDRLLGLLVSAAADLRRLVAAGVPVR